MRFHLSIGMLFPALVVAAAFSISQARENHAGISPSASVPVLSISQTLAKMKDASAFYAALQTTGWEVLLDGPGTFPYTVFAPTNAAFAKLTERGYASLLQPASKNKLRAVMSFHAVSGSYLMSSLKDGQVLHTAHGEMNLTVSRRNGHTWVKGGTAEPVEVHTTDILCDNGVIHVIDEVLLPVVLHVVPASRP